MGDRETFDAAIAEWRAAQEANLREVDRLRSSLREAECCDAPEPVQGCDCRRCLMASHRRHFLRAERLAARLEVVEGALRGLLAAFNGCEVVPAFWAVKWKATEAADRALSCSSEGEGGGTR